MLQPIPFALDLPCPLPYWVAKKAPSSDDPNIQIKKLALIALFSEDELLDCLVLKGGNALAIAYGLDNRVSADIDLSMPTEFDAAELNRIRERITYRLEQTFKHEGWTPFDIKLEEKPPVVSKDLAGFWGGYSLDFRLLETETFNQYDGNLHEIRRRALPVGPNNRTRFGIDISKHEFCELKQPFDIDGYTIYVYTPLLLFCEKLRAICQQMPEYDKIVRRQRDRRTPRPRDFLDIHTLLNHSRDIDLDAPETRDVLIQVFKNKRVPLRYLMQIQHTFEQHATGWSAVRDTVRKDYDLKDFRFYFNYVCNIVEKLHPVGNV